MSLTSYYIAFHDPIWVALLSTALFFPVRQLIWVLYVRKKQKMSDLEVSKGIWAFLGGKLIPEGLGRVWVKGKGQKQGKQIKNQRFWVVTPPPPVLSL